MVDLERRRVRDLSDSSSSSWLRPPELKEKAKEEAFKPISPMDSPGESDIEEKIYDERAGLNDYPGYIPSIKYPPGTIAEKADWGHLDPSDVDTDYALNRINAEAAENQAANQTAESEYSQEDKKV